MFIAFLINECLCFFQLIHQYKRYLLINGLDLLLFILPYLNRDLVQKYSVCLIASMSMIIIVNRATDPILRLQTAPDCQNATPQNQISRESDYGKAT